MPITAITTAAFTPKCTGSVSVSTVTNAATAYDWFGSAGAVGTALASMSTSTAVGIQNKAFVQSLAQMGRSSLVPYVKAELFHATLPDNLATIKRGIDNCLNSLTSLQLTNIDTATKTALSASYTAELGSITAALNRIKTLENKVYAVGDSIDIPATGGSGATASLGNIFAAVVTAAPTASTKAYLSIANDPAYTGGVPAVSGVSTMPTLTPATYANAGTLAGYFTTAQSAAQYSTFAANLIATVETGARALFDTHCVMVQSYSSSATSGKWPTGSVAPVGIVPGVDYDMFISGTFQTGSASAGTAGAPSATTPFWI